MDGNSLHKWNFDQLFFVSVFYFDIHMRVMFIDFNFMYVSLYGVERKIYSSNSYSFMSFQNVADYALI